MRIALTHNLQLRDTEEEAEFDRPETIAALTEALRRLGHVVEPVEVSGPASQTVARLESLAPDVVFNTAEGRRGRFREAFYPGLFDELGLPYTGSDAWVCALTLDKRLTKILLAGHGVPMPGSVFVEKLDDLVDKDLRFPVIVKPNFEGSSKGISLDSIVEDPHVLPMRVGEILARYPLGVLVEEFIEGRDVTVPFLEGASPATGGVLAAAEYEFDPKAIAGRKYAIYDYHLKQVAYDAVSVKVPAQLDPDTRRSLEEHTRRIVRILGIRDLGRIDYRVAPDGKPYFLEINALPSLEPGASIYRSAELAGLGTVDVVLETVVRSAAARHGVISRGPIKKRKGLSVGLVFNLKRVKPSGGDDKEAEFDAPTTIAAIREALESYGHRVIELEATPELPTILPVSGIDVAFNIAEGIRGRNREAQIPALLELLDIPYTGSDPAALSLALDKSLAKRVVAQAGVSTPPHVVMRTGKERLPRGFWFPAIVKPSLEGSSKGVEQRSVVENEAQLRERARELIDRYRQAALAESFLPGREFTIGLLGERRPKVLPPMEILFLDSSEPHPVYSFEHKLAEGGSVTYRAPAEVDVELGRALERTARMAFHALGCRDVARVDLRLDGNGNVHFIECNPLPGLTPNWSDLCLVARAAGMEYRTLIGEILAPAVRRLKERRSEQQGRAV